MSEKPTLHIIQGSAGKDDPRLKAAKVRKRKPSAVSVLSCHRCGCNAVMEVKVAMLYKDGKAQGGTKQIVCAMCLSKGQMVVLA